MIRAAVYGRLGADPVERRTRTGGAMTTANLAANVSRDGAEEAETEWFSVVGFGRAAEDLARHAKGDLVAVMGQVSRTRFTGRDGQERISWSVTAEAILSTRTVRPGGRLRTSEVGRPKPRPTNGRVGNGGSRYQERASLPNDEVSDSWQN
jgi:single-strand DNA-binding protein